MSAPFSAFLLAGGSSRRMGSDKALLLAAPGQTLLARQSALLSSLTTDVSLLAPAGKYPQSGLPVLPDLRPNCGPLAAIETALVHSKSPWSLVLAVDHAEITSNWLAKLAAHALASPSFCVTSATAPHSPSPLAAFWHRSALPAVQLALDQRNFRVRDVLATIPHELVIPKTHKFCQTGIVPKTSGHWIPSNERNLSALH